MCSKASVSFAAIFLFQAPLLSLLSPTFECATEQVLGEMGLDSLCSCFQSCNSMILISVPSCLAISTIQLCMCVLVGEGVCEMEGVGEGSSRERSCGPGCLNWREEDFSWVCCPSLAGSLCLGRVNSPLPKICK